MPGPLGIRRQPRRQPSLPSRHYGIQFWFIDGPLDGQQAPYRGKRVRVTVATEKRLATERNQKGDLVALEAEIPVAGEYIHQSRNVGKGLGYEHYYQWFGRSE